MWFQKGSGFQNRARQRSNGPVGTDFRQSARPFLSRQSEWMNGWLPDAGSRSLSAA